MKKSGLTLQEKKDYVKEVDDYVSSKGVKVSNAIVELGKASSFYYRFKNDIRRAGFGGGLASAFENRENNKTKGEVELKTFILSVKINDEVHTRLESRADRYGVEPAVIASILLYDAVLKFDESKK